VLPSQTRARTVLTMEDLSAALKEYGVQADRAAYYL
jgi:transcription initiation factor TFIID subunit 10